MEILKQQKMKSKKLLKKQMLLKSLISSQKGSILELAQVAANCQEVKSSELLLPEPLLKIQKF